MGEVSISVAGRAYQVVCEDGEENRLTAIAARVDREAQAFGGATPSLSESRLLLMCALLLADKLDEAENTSRTSPAMAATAEMDTSALDDATARIEALAQPNGQDAATLDGRAAPSDDAEPPEQAERRSKSSAAVAAERDLLSWADRPDSRDADEADDVSEDDVSGDAGQETAPDTEPVEEIAPDPAPALGSDAEAEEATGDETDAEREARERSERRKRRRERLARLANDDGDDA